MDNKFKNILVKEYIKNTVKYISNNEGIEISEDFISSLNNKYLDREEEYNELMTMISNDITLYTKNKDTKEELDTRIIKLDDNKKEPKEFGFSYNSNLIDVFKLYENVNKKNETYESREKAFNDALNIFNIKSKNYFRNYLASITNDEKTSDNLMKSLYLGFESLNYNVVEKLYNIFHEDINIVSPKVEGLISFKLNKDEELFNYKMEINRNISFNFTRLKIIFDYAKKHKKDLSLNSLLSFEDIPESLIRSVDKTRNSNLPINTKRKLIRKMCLEFLSFYYYNLSLFCKENNYEIKNIIAISDIAANYNNDYRNKLKDEIDVLQNERKFNKKLDLDNDIAFKVKEFNDSKFLRTESFWYQNINDNPLNGDKYFIDVLKIIRNYFPNTKLIYEDYNEFLEDKTESIIKTLELIENVEKRDNINLIDYMGLKGHYLNTPYLASKDKIDIEDINKSALSFSKINKPIYITDYSFIKVINKNEEELENRILDVYGKLARGVISPSNTDYITTLRAISLSGKYLESSLIDINGDKKDSYYKLLNVLGGIDSETIKELEEEINKDKTLEYSGRVKVKIDDSPRTYLIHKKETIDKNTKIPLKLKQTMLKDITYPLSHGPDELKDNIIHVYISKLVNINSPLKKEEIYDEIIKDISRFKYHNHQITEEKTEEQKEKEKLEIKEKEKKVISNGFLTFILCILVAILIVAFYYLNYN